MYSDVKIALSEFIKKNYIKAVRRRQIANILSKNYTFYGCFNQPFFPLEMVVDYNKNVDFLN